MNFSIFVILLFATAIVASFFLVFVVSAQQTVPVTTFGPNSFNPDFCNNVANSILLYTPPSNPTATPVAPLQSVHDSNKKHRNQKSNVRKSGPTPDSATSWAVPEGTAPTNGNGKIPQQKKYTPIVPLYPITFKTSAFATAIAQTDVVSRIKQVTSASPPLSPPGPPGSSFSATYNFFVILAAATEGQRALQKFSDATFWTQISNSFPASDPTNNKPYIFDVQKFTTTAWTSPYAFSEILGQTSARMEDLKERLATGYLVAVVMQSRTHQNGICTSFFSPALSLPWGLVQSRTIPALIVGVDSKYVYYVDPCYKDTIQKLTLELFLQRWHSYEFTSSPSSSSPPPVAVSRRAFYFMGNSTSVDGTNNAVQDKGTNWRDTAKLVFMDSSSMHVLLSNDAEGLIDFQNVQSG